MMRRLFQLSIANPALFENAIRDAGMDDLRAMLAEASKEQAVVIEREIKRRNAASLFAAILPLMSFVFLAAVLS